ncbi:MAG: glycosyltransferase 87 family protein, partial [Saprospiraceae bacterium]|nr:glycosyltransferase 87 family protein [Saprospiraceae bacterium]
MSELNSQTRARRSALLFICLIGGLITFGGIYDVFDYFFGRGWAVVELRTILQLIIVDDDSWWPMYNAANARLHGEGIYQTVFFEEGIKFQYPPLSILPCVVFIKMGMGWETIREVMNFISFVAILSIIGLIYYLTISVFKKFSNIENFDWKYKISFLLIAIVGTFGFDAIVKAQYLGQIQVLLDLCIGLAFLMFLINKKYLSGACLALAALVKPQITLLLIWAIIR